MSKFELLLQLPAGALKEIANWLAWSHERFRKRSGWVKVDYADELAKTITVQETQVLLEELRRDGEGHYTNALLVRLFGLPPKEVMLARTKAQLRDLMEQLEDEGRVAVSWRSMSTGALRDYLQRKLSAPEIARLIDLDVPLEKKRFVARAQQGIVAPDSAATPPVPAVEPAAPPPSAPHRERSPIERLEDLRRYLVDEFHSELDALEDLGNNEQRFQHRIVNVLERRVSAEPFAIDEKLHLSDLDQYPDIVIQHARGNTAFEIKPSGSLNDLLGDAQKLKGYLRAKRVRVTFGVLVYRSPFAVPDELRRAMNSTSLHIVRVNTRRR